MASPDTLLHIITDSGSSPDPEIGEFAPLAGSVQAQLHRDSASPFLSLTRSTALWTLLRIRTDISDALRPCGLNADDLGAVVGIAATTLKPEPPGDVELIDDFARAVRRYLADPPPIFTLADLASAILRAVRDDARSGELPDRLRRLNVDLPRAIAAIDALVQAGRTARSSPRLPLVSEIDPYDFGVHTGADGPRGRNLNPYVARDLDRSIDELLTREHAVIVTAAGRAGAGRTVYEALNRVLPSAYVYRTPRPGEFGPEELGAIPAHDACVLWIDKLGSQWGVLGTQLARAVTNWLGAGENRWFVAVHYDGEPNVLDSPEFTRLRIPTVRLEAKLSSRELESEQRAYGHTAVTELIGGNPPQQAEVAAAALVPDRLAGGTDRDLVDPTKGIPLARDRLDVKDYVTMLATVMADQRTQMPLSVGLFGEWGSGKSFFMGLLRGQVKELGEKDPKRYYKDIVQLGFNAWHYSDSNLWASIGDTIFSQLTDPGTTGKDRSAELRRELAANNERRHELEQATERAQHEVANLEKGIQRARQDKGVRAKAVVGAIANEPTISKEFDKAFNKLGVTSDVARAKVLASDLTGAKEDLASVRRRLTGWRVSVAVIAVALVVAAVVLVVGLSSSWTARQLTGSLALVGSVIAVASAVMGRVRSGLRSLAALISDIDHRSREQTDRELARELEALRTATANEQVLRAQLDDVIARAGELGTELAQASPGQRLYRFVSERADSDDYRGQLGLISTIRKDFEQLIELMEKWRKSGDEIRKPIPRIILYIDDLDRCSPKQVVEVLQAVHLLLALKLFVVVVGVDPRWLLRSLGREFRSTLTEGASGDPDWSLSTPQDYLEKIFNIPFILPAMGTENFSSLLRGLAEDASNEETEEPAETDETDGSHDQPDVSHEPADQLTPSANAGGGQPADQNGKAPTRADTSKPTSEPRPPAESSVRDTVDRGAPLTGPEIELLSSLAPLVRTPRSAKRLLNLYRLLRSTPEPGLAEGFLGADGRAGEFQAVAVLVGLLTGYPQLLGDLLLAPADGQNGRAGGLLYRISPEDRAETWQTFVESLKPVQNGQSSSNAVAGHLDEAQAAEWGRLIINLAPSSELVKLEGLDAFQRWAPRVARFSFRLAPVVLDRRAPRPGRETSPNGSEDAVETQAPDPVST